MAAPRGPGAGALTFVPLYHADLLDVVNPRGDVGLVTLWSPRRAVSRKLDESSLLHPDTTRVAVMSNLYGDGMLAMFCNLLFNPQVRHLVAVGEDLGLGTCEEIEAFLRDGLEDDVMLGSAVKRVRGTSRVFPVVEGFDEARLRGSLSFRYLGKLSRPGFAQELAGYLDTLPRGDVDPNAERVRVELPTGLEPDHAYKPSQVGGHQVIRAAPLDCWEELVVRTVRFGRPVSLRKGLRLELRNVKAVVTDPAPEPPEVLAEYGFDSDRFRAYQERILSPELPEGIAYTYGNRLRGYFPQPAGGTDTLQSAIALLQEDPETRAAYISLWDDSRDLPPGSREKPCLTTLFFRRSEGRLTLTTTYRSHSLLGGWLENVYGLMAIQRHVAERVDMEPGEIAVISHSLGINPASPRYELARRVCENRKRDDDFDRSTGKYRLREDPNGYFVVTADTQRGCLVAEHRFGGVLIKRYESDRAATIERQVSADMAVSLVSHALWLGRELTAKEQALRAAK